MSTFEHLKPHEKDLGGGFLVRRSLPAATRQAVGPFVFFDHFGPITAGPSDNHDVRPHPHIGLATVTYLFEGAMMHRDSTGIEQRIEPGAINWMTAGRGISHSERTPDDLRGVTRRSHGLQLWAALPPEHEEDAPSFSHTPAADVPSVALPGVAVRVMLGSAFGLTSPTPTVSPTVYVDLAMSPNASVRIPDVAEERALYVIDHDVTVDGMPATDGGSGPGVLPARTMLVVPAGVEPVVTAPLGARLVLIGGQPLGPRFIWWNFVSTRKERIEQAAEDWRAQRFDRVPGETEFIPAPATRVAAPPPQAPAATAGTPDTPT